MPTLTIRQKQVYDYIKKYIKRKGYSPTLEEIRGHFRLSSLSTVHEHLNTLLNKGLIIKNRYSARGVALKENFGTMVEIPFLGTIAAGEPIGAVRENETIAVPQSTLPKSGRTFALRVKGNSMIDENIKDGDVVLVKQQDVARNGERVVALIDNYEATLKKLYKERGRIRLQPANSAYEPIIITKDKDFRIQGVVVDVIRQEKTSVMQLPGYEKRETYAELPLDKIICGDAVEVMKKFPSNSVDIVVTSPPYDAVRDYKGFSLDLHAAGKEIYRVLKDGGVAVMVIQDQTKNFGKSLTSFKTIIDWCDTIGFKLFETTIYRKYGAEGAWWNKRFRVDHEYIPIFLKGERPQYFNKEHLKIPSKHGGKTMTGGGTRLTNGVRIATRSIKINPTKCRGTIWEYLTAGDGSRLKHQHPATFPNQLPYDFIRCFCPKDGVVLDPFVGSGTTTVAAKKLGHHYIGIDIAPEYCEIAKKRINQECVPESQKSLL